MASKTKNSNKKAPAIQEAENSLPQNFLIVGERVYDNKNIYILQAVYKAIAKFTENKTTTESGGLLVGTVVEELGKTNIIISGFIEAKHCEATPTTLKFTHETWEYCHNEIDKKHKGKKIVGWIHTHPNFGIFLSDYDKFIQNNFFNEEYQIAYVVDPIQHTEGFYYWINGSIEKCAGFYIYDEVGKKLTLLNKPEDTEDLEQKEKSSPFFNNIIITALCVIILFLTFNIYSLNMRVNQLTNDLFNTKVEFQSFAIQAQNLILSMQNNQQNQNSADTSQPDLTVGKSSIATATDANKANTSNN